MGREYKQTFFQRKHRDGQQAHEKMLTLLIIRKIQTKSTMRYHLTPARMAVIKKTRNNKCQQGSGEKGTLVHCWWDCKLQQSLRKRVWRLLKKLKTELLYDQAISLLSIYLQKTETLIQEDICTPMFTEPLLINC